MIKKFFFFIIILPFSVPAQNQETRVKSDDLVKLLGEVWKGTLTYKDYGTGKSVTIKTGLKVEKQEENLFIFQTSYPDEPEMNSTDSIRLEKNGSMLNNASVMRRAMKGDTVVVVTEKKIEQDDGSILQFRYTYKIHPSYFLITKVEKPTGSEDYIERNRYVFRRD